MTMSLVWMRHGACNDGISRPDAHARPESPLSPQGTRQVARTAHALAAAGITSGAVASSTLLRARTTARIVADIAGLALLEPNSVFDEWRAPTCVLGRTPAQYPDAYIDWRLLRSRRPETSLPGGESLIDFSRRAEDALDEAMRLAEQETYVLIVSHRLLIGAVAALHDGVVDPAQTFDRARNYALAPAAMMPMGINSRVRPRL